MKKEQFEIKTVSISEKFEGLRLDHFLAKSQILETRSKALKLISQKKIFLNKKNPKASHRVQKGELLTIHLEKTEEEEQLTPCFENLDLLFEDKDLIVINKPARLVVHPAPGNKKNTLVNRLIHKKTLSPGSHPLRPGIVHRLDKNTSGILIVTKTLQAQNMMIEKFKNRKIKREYWAISLRPPSPLKDKIETWIKRHPIHRKKFISLNKFQKGAKKAITSYKLFKQSKTGLSWIKCHLETGRTHQIRVHLSSLSCPIVGDEIYGGKKKLSFIKDAFLKEEIRNLNRIALHAHKLSFEHPISSKKLCFSTSWPLDLKKLLKQLNWDKE